MKVVKEFLQSSTIHGLAYIATTDKLTRIFWMIVVLSGFTWAALLIMRSRVVDSRSKIAVLCHKYSRHPKPPAFTVLLWHDKY